MKNIFLVFLFLMPALALSYVPVYPQVFNMQTSVQLQIHNTTKTPIICSGPVNIHLQIEGFTTQFYQGYIYPGVIGFQTFYPRYGNDLVYSAYHSISCYEAK